MPAEIQLFADEAHSVPHDGHLGETDVALGEGEARPIFGCNTGTTVVREVAFALDGEGAMHVQLAVDDNGKPGVWAMPGESVIPVEGEFHPGQGFVVWAKPIYAFSDHEGEYEFNFLVTGVSVG